MITQEYKKYLVHTDYINSDKRQSSPYKRILNHLYRYPPSRRKSFSDSTPIGALCRPYSATQWSDKQREFYFHAEMQPLSSQVIKVVCTLDMT